jgi:hypothetical protein
MSRLAQNIIYMINHRKISSDIFIDRYYKDESFILEQLKLFPKKTYNHIKKIFPDIENVIENECSELFSKYNSFYVYGCPNSTDIDVACIIDKEYITNAIPKPLLKSEYMRLCQELESIGYDVHMRGIDLNLLCIEAGSCIAQLKGGIDTTNILKYTYDLHKQYYELDFPIEFIESTDIDKIKAMAKFIFDYIKDVVLNYHELREERQKTYMRGSEEMIKSSLIYIKYIQTNPDDKKKKWFDFMKSITMKIIQLIIFTESKLYLYTKDEMTKISNSYGFVVEGIEYLLYRGTRGRFCENTIIKLFDYYIMIVDKYYKTLNCTTISYHKSIVQNTTRLNDELFREFIISPNVYTETFEKEWIEQNYENVNELFPINSTEIEKIKLPRHIIENHLYQISQRSDEWMKLMKCFKCGKSGADIKDTMTGKYNLIRGSITESIIIDLFDPSQIQLFGWEKVTTGMIVENKEIPGSTGCSPDLLLVKDNMIIPVEIKTLHDYNHNCDYYNKLELAQKQCQSVEKILGKHLIYSNLVIISYWKDDLVLECYLF